MRQFTTILLAGLLAVSCNSGKKDKDPVTVKTDTVPGTEVNKSDNMKVDNTNVPKVTLSITPQDVAASQGQITFTQNEKTIFYYNLKTKKGSITLNGAPQALDKYSFDSKTFSYTLSGSAVNINTGNGKFKENKGEDCSYGNFAAVTITMGKDTLTVNNVAVQDCPDY